MRLPLTESASCPTPTTSSGSGLAGSATAAPARQSATSNASARSQKKSASGGRVQLPVSPAHASAAAMRKERCPQAVAPQASVGSSSRRGSSASRRAMRARCGPIYATSSATASPREGNPGELYDQSHDRTDAKAFAERGEGDRHQFRFIVAPEDSAEIADLKPFVRDLMRQVESDLGTRLDWVAADHFNTGHPHSHIVVRGKDDRGTDLVIARDYIAHGMRARASELITRELGPESELDHLRKLEQEVGAERFTRLDRAILRDARDGVLALSAKLERDPRHHAMQMGRLRALERLGLAEETAPGIWRIAGDIEPTLRRMGERGDIIKIMHRDLRDAGLNRAAADQAVFDPNAGGRIVGRLVAEGFSDELRERRYAIVDGVDG